MSHQRPNKPAAPNPAITSQFHLEVIGAGSVSRIVRRLSRAMKRRAILLFIVCCQAIHVDATRLCARFRRHCGFCSAHIHARDHIRTFLLCLPGALGADDVTYSDVFLKHYPVRGREFDIANYALEAPSIIWDDLCKRKVTVLRTRGDKYPYEEQKCVITVEGSGFETPRVLSAAHFRTVDVSWITGKLILIW